MIRLDVLCSLHIPVVACKVAGDYWDRFCPKTNHFEMIDFAPEQQTMCRSSVSWNGLAAK